MYVFRRCGDSGFVHLGVNNRLLALVSFRGPSIIAWSRSMEK
jgi:hypothetical protein